MHLPQLPQQWRPSSISYLAVEMDGGAGQGGTVRYTRDGLRSVLLVMGVKPRYASKLVVLMFTKLMNTTIPDLLRPARKRPAPLAAWGLGVHNADECYVTLPRSDFANLILSSMTEYKYKSCPGLDELKTACSLREGRRCVVVLLSGTSGSGKSTLASLLATRLGITTVLSTDSVRHLLRSFQPKETAPMLWTSTYEAGKLMRDAPLTWAHQQVEQAARTAPVCDDAQPGAGTAGVQPGTTPAGPVQARGEAAAAVQAPLGQACESGGGGDAAAVTREQCIQGYKAQCQAVIDHLAHIIAGHEARCESLIIEGVHLHISHVVTLMKRHPCCVPFLLHIKSEAKHVERMAVRAKYMALEPEQNKYVAHMQCIRWIQEYLVKKAEKRGLPRVENSNVDRSVGLIHMTLLGVLRRVSRGESVWDASSLTTRMLQAEFAAAVDALVTSAQEIVDQVKAQQLQQHLQHTQGPGGVAGTDSTPSSTLDVVNYTLDTRLSQRSSFTAPPGSAHELGSVPHEATQDGFTEAAQPLCMSSVPPATQPPASLNTWQHQHTASAGGRVEMRLRSRLALASCHSTVQLPVGTPPPPPEQAPPALASPAAAAVPSDATAASGLTSLGMRLSQYDSPACSARSSSPATNNPSRAAPGGAEQQQAPLTPGASQADSASRLTQGSLRAHRKGGCAESAGDVCPAQPSDVHAAGVHLTPSDETGSDQEALTQRQARCETSVISTHHPALQTLQQADQAGGRCTAQHMQVTPPDDHQHAAAGEITYHQLLQPHGSQPHQAATGGRGAATQEELLVSQQQQDDDDPDFGHVGTVPVLPVTHEVRSPAAPEHQASLTQQLGHAGSPFAKAARDLTGGLHSSCVPGSSAHSAEAGAASSPSSGHLQGACGGRASDGDSDSGAESEVDGVGEVPGGGLGFGLQGVGRREHGALRGGLPGASSAAESDLECLNIMDYASVYESTVACDEDMDDDLEGMVPHHHHHHLAPLPEGVISPRADRQFSARSPTAHQFHLPLHHLAASRHTRPGGMRRAASTSARPAAHMQQAMLRHLNAATRRSADTPGQQARDVTQPHHRAPQSGQEAGTEDVS